MCQAPSPPCENPRIITRFSSMLKRFFTAAMDSLETLAGFLAFRGIWAIYIHSNVGLPIGPLRMFIGAPELHHWHHSREREAGNYANISPLMDLIFGTYRCPPHEPEALGVTDPMPKTYFAQMLHPFRSQ